MISQLTYGGFRVRVHAPGDQVRAGAEIVYYGGDIAELLLAAALVTAWRPQGRTRRVAAPGPAPAPPSAPCRATAPG